MYERIKNEQKKRERNTKTNWQKEGNCARKSEINHEQSICYAVKMHKNPKTGIYSNLSRNLTLLM